MIMTNFATGNTNVVVEVRGSVRLSPPSGGDWDSLQLPVARRRHSQLDENSPESLLIKINFLLDISMQWLTLFRH